MNELKVQKVYKTIQKKIQNLPEKKQTQIKFLKNYNVFLWLYGITTFIEPKNSIIGYNKKKINIDTGKVYKSGKKKGNKIYKKKKVDDIDNPKYKYTKTKLKEKKKENEDNWNMKLMKPFLKNTNRKQKSAFGPFGEKLVKEYYIITDEFLTDKPIKKKNHKLDLETKLNIIEVKSGSYFTTGTAREKIYGVPFKYADVPRLFKKTLLIICIGGGDNCELTGKTNIPEREEIKQFYKGIGIFYVSFTELLNNL